MCNLFSDTPPHTHLHFNFYYCSLCLFSCSLLVTLLLFLEYTKHMQDSVLNILTAKLETAVVLSVSISTRGVDSLSKWAVRPNKKAHRYLW